MFVSGRPIMLLLCHLFGSVTSLSTNTPAPPFPSQISPPSAFPSNLPSLPSSPPAPPTTPPFISGTGSSPRKASCPLTMSPSTLVVRFEDPVTVNCSVSSMGYSLLGWEVPLEAPQATMDRFLLWSVDRMLMWSIRAVCFALSEQGGQCQVELPVLVYKPPDNVSISFDEPMFEGHQYTLKCHVQDVAPVENLTMTFYKGQKSLGQFQSNDTKSKKPTTEIFTMETIPSMEDDGAQYWCEAKLELGAEGPQPPPVVTSQKLSARVLFGPHFLCPTKLQVREGESLICDVRGNPQPLVTWIRDGQEVAKPTCLNRKHAGKYTVWTKGHHGLKNFTVEVEVLDGRGTANSCSRNFLSGILLIQMIHWL